MSYKTTISIKAAQSDESDEVVVELDDREHQLMERFLGHVRDMEATRICRDNLGVKLSIKYHKKTGLSGTFTGPAWDDIYVLLHLLRPLILKDELTSFPRVRAGLGRKLKASPIARQYLRYLGDEYSGKSMQAQIQLLSNDIVVNSEEMLFKWLNAHEYHRDNEKQAFIGKLCHILPFEWMRGVFLSLLLDKVKAIRGLTRLVEAILAKHGDLPPKTFPNSD